jgi:hypothetical protein
MRLTSTSRASNAGSRFCSVTGVALALAFVAAGVVVFVVLYGVWMARRLDRLHARVDAAAAALEAQLIRRALTAETLGAAVPLNPTTAAALTVAARAAAVVPGLGHDREVAEGAVTRVLTGAIAAAPGAFTQASTVAVEMHDQALRATFARRFYNDAVRDALVVRDRRVTRWLRLAGHAPHPAYFEMDDEELAVTRISVAAGPTIET